MTIVARFVRSILVLTLLAGCSLSDPIGPTSSGITPDGSRVAEPARVDGGLSFDSFEATTAFDFSTAVNGIRDETPSAGIADPKAAVITIFADPTPSTVGSSGIQLDLGTHAFVTVRNISASPVTVGRLAGIQPGRTVSIGTWGNKTEHTGLWYNLEAYLVFKSSAYPKRVSAAYLLSASQLATLTTFIKNNDSWSVSKTSNNNCATFAAGAWNVVVDSYSKLSAGFPDTPKVTTQVRGEAF